jgi:hypothetical protein
MEFPRLSVSLSLTTLASKARRMNARTCVDDSIGILIDERREIRGESQDSVRQLEA